MGFCQGGSGLAGAVRAGVSLIWRAYPYIRVGPSNDFYSIRREVLPCLPWNPNLPT